MKKTKIKHKNSNSIDTVMTKITSVFLTLLLTVFLFYTGNKGFVDIQNAKYKAFMLLCGGYILIALICIIEGALIGAIKIPSFKSIFKGLTSLQKTTLLYLVFTWISAIISSHFPETIVGATRYEGALTITIYCVVFLLVSCYGKIDKFMIWLFSSVSLIFGAICIIQLFDVNIFNLYPEGYKYSDAYVAYPGAYLGTIGNVDLVAAFLCLTIPIVSTSLIKLKGKIKLLLLMPLATLVFVLIKMNVLAGLVGVFIGTLMIIPIVFIKEHKHKIIYIFSVIGTGLIGLLLVYVVDLPFELLHQIHEMMHGSVSETFGSGRIHIWKCVISDLPNHFWFGSGPDTMVYTELEPFKRYDATLNSMIVSGIDVAHNEYLNVLSQQGIFAFVVYIAIVTCSIYKWIKMPFENMTSKIFGSALLCYFIQAFFGFSMCMTAPFFWVTLGLFDKSLKGEEIICGRK